MKVQLVVLLACGVILSQQRRYYSNNWQRYDEWEGPYATSTGNRRYVIGEDMVMDFKEYLRARNLFHSRRFEPFISLPDIDVVHQPSDAIQKQVLYQFLLLYFVS